MATHWPRLPVLLRFVSCGAYSGGLRETTAMSDIEPATAAALRRRIEAELTELAALEAAQAVGPDAQQGVPVPVGRRQHDGPWPVVGEQRGF
jgi:hypothetical protein